MEISTGPFEPTWESLRTFECPDWFRDAKFGIWSHWGPQSVPMYGDWYARHMYIEGSDQYRYHIRKYGHPSQFGYKDVVKLWKAEHFDPDALMGLYAQAGARYFVAQAAHHDNFHNWNSSRHPWNSVKMGPGRDIVALWQAAARARGLPFGFSEHMGATFTWFKPNKGADKTGPFAGVPYDGNDPADESLYLPNQTAGDLRGEWYTRDPWWHEKWFGYVKELIDLYQPDLLYSDGGVPFGEYGLNIVAHLYNSSARRSGGRNQAVYTQKDRDINVLSVGVFDIERSQRPDIFPYVWQTDTSVGDWFYNVRDVYKTPRQVIEMLVDIVSKNGNLLLNIPQRPDIFPYVWQTDTSVGDWFYNVRDVYKTPRQVIEMLVDIVSKNGNLLLNIPQRPDGTLDDECDYLLRKLAGWIKVNGEAIYGTRPWKVSGEGVSRVVIEGFREDAVDWTIEDFRFTTRDGRLYAFQMKWPEGGKTVIRSLGGASAPVVARVTVLGYPGPVKFEQTTRGLAIDLPEIRPVECAQCYRIDFA